MFWHGWMMNPEDPTSTTSGSDDLCCLGVKQGKEGCSRHPEHCLSESVVEAWGDRALGAHAEHWSRV